MADIRAFFKDLLPKPDWSSITGTIFNQGESTERRALDVVLRGNDGSIQNLQPGLKHKATYSTSTTTTHTVTGKAITISNDGASDLTVTINDIVTTVLSGETIDKSVLCYDSFTTVLVTTTVAYRLFVYEESKEAT